MSEHEVTNGHHDDPLTIKHSATITKIAAAFVRAQGEIANATKDANNPHFGSKYADLASVDAACRPALNKHGVAIIQTPATPTAQGRVAITTTLLHESGEFLSCTGELPVQGNGPQAFGSAITYCRRYFLAAMCGVCPEDDDGEGAEGRGQTPANARQNVRPPARGRPAPPPPTEPPPTEPPPAPKASAEQVARAKELLAQVKLPDGTTAKWFKAAGVTTWEAMTAEQIDKSIAYLQKVADGEIVPGTNLKQPQERQKAGAA